ncbi:ATPase [Tractidigestivibacter scatoligenes]|jgi:F-type H+-transporting ATPase subunit delta|uniref:ATP synthase subunit delta n=1 Tax=Tractidigestivibacter scatoligenes TaxID=1299998 RepID=A0A100YW59_TRASO|nr:F0F1 ATP synthase subunit delta [Tractidigestivibacter scatoligenes]KUH58790.1 ATPase [Tractidigestivibacter scatoligenes]
MSIKRADEQKAEAYTRALLEAARQQGRANADLVQWQHAKKFSPEVLETLTAMQAENDSGLIDQVAKKYQELLDNEDTTVSVTVTTAVPMDEALRGKVRAQSEKMLNAPVYLVERVDPSILGGVVIEARGKRMDASVRAQLSLIRKTLSSAFIGGEEQ